MDSGMSDSGMKDSPGENGSGSGKKEGSFRAVIDTSAPFESVKEAVTRFGGIGFWKPSHRHKLSVPEHEMEEIDIAKVEEQAAILEKDLILKERETLNVLRALESTKSVVEELKVKLQKQASEVNVHFESSVHDANVILSSEKEMKNSHETIDSSCQDFLGGLGSCPSSAPGLILLELKQAKLNLCRTTNDLADIQGSVEQLKKKLEKERNSLEKTHERLTLNSCKMSSLEEELNQTNLKLQAAKDASENPSDIPKKLQLLSSEAENFKKLGEAAKSEVLRAMSEIEQTKTKIKTAEIRLVAARKLKEAARATEAVALADIKAISSHGSSAGDSSKKLEGVTLTFQEYSSLTCKVREAEELSKIKVMDAMLPLDEANVSRMDVLRRIEEVTEEVKISKKALEEALSRVEAANKGKLAVEEVLRKWRSDHGQKRRSVHNNTKFKNSYPAHKRRDPRLLDVNGINLAGDGPEPVLKQTLSIGQILSRKLLLPEEFETEMMPERGSMKRNVSLGQMLNKQNRDLSTGSMVEKENCQKQFSGKRKKFGFARFSLLLAKQSKKKKSPTLNLSKEEQLKLKLNLRSYWVVHTSNSQCKSYPSLIEGMKQIQ